MEEENKSKGPRFRKENDENNPFGERKSPGPRFNPYWIYGILFVGFLILTFYKPPQGKESNWNEVREMIIANDVKTIEIVNDRLAKVYLTPEAKSNEKYVKVVENSKGVFSNGDKTPQYFFETSKEYFYPNFEAIKKEHPEAAKIIVEQKVDNDISGQILYWVIMIALFIAFWSFMMRRMGGGGGGAGGPGQIFNIGRSRAQLFDKNTKVNVTFKDVAGLEEAKTEVMEIVDFLKILKNTPT